MKKFTILMSLFCLTLMAGSAFAEESKDQKWHSFYIFLNGEGFTLEEALADKYGFDMQARIIELEKQVTLLANRLNKSTKPDETIVEVEPVVVVEPAIESESGWEMINETDDMTDKITTAAISSTQVGYKSRYLVVRCNKGVKLEIYVGWDEYIGEDYVPVKIRWGSEDVIKAGFWNKSMNNTSVFAKNHNVRGYIKNLMKHDKFVVGLTPYNEAPQTTVFNVTGKEALLKVVTACNVADSYR